MEWSAAVGGWPWVDGVLVAVGIFALVAVLSSLRGWPGRAIRARVAEVDRSGVLRIGAGRGRGIRPGFVFTVCRPVASRRFERFRATTVDLRLVPIGQARVLTVGLADALCRFEPLAGMGPPREGDVALAAPDGREGCPAGAVERDTLRAA